jgi:hypothetical protein
MARTFFTPASAVTPWRSRSTSLVVAHSMNLSGHAPRGDGRVDAGVGEVLDDGVADAAGQDMVFEGQQRPALIASFFRQAELFRSGCQFMC